MAGVCKVASVQFWLIGLQMANDVLGTEAVTNAADALSLLNTVTFNPHRKRIEKYLALVGGAHF